MRIPLGHKRRTAVTDRRTPHEFLMKVFVPGCVVWYLVYTQPVYISLMTRGESDLVTAEVLYLSLHIVFTYVVLPITWLLDFLEFSLRGLRLPVWMNKTLHLSTYALFWLLLVAVILRVSTLPWYT